MRDVLQGLSFNLATSSDARIRERIRNWWPKIFIAIFVSAVMACAGGQYDTSAIWPKTWVYLPAKYAPNVSNLPTVDGLQSVKPAALPSPGTKVPTVIFMHGCAGYHYGFAEVAYPAHLAEAGFAVFVPNSYARPGRESECHKVTMNTVLMRLEEVRLVLKGLQDIPWVDKRNLFLAGHSEGGMTTAHWSGSEFNAYFISGWTCTSLNNPDFAKLEVPRDKPVLAVIGDSDPWYGGNNIGACDVSGHPGSESIVLKGVGHEVMYSGNTVDRMIAFFKANIKS